MLGGVVGFVFGWVVSPFSRVVQGNLQPMFIAWLHYPVAYCPYVAAGAVTAGLGYYAADLLTGARYVTR